MTPVIPTIRYQDANAAIAWLKSALGFTEQAVYRNAAGQVEHAQLLFAGGMVMIGTADLNTEANPGSVTPQQAGGVTSSVYLAVPSCNPLYATAKAARAHFLQDLKTMDYGGQAFTVRDPEGHHWAVGEYDPWATHYVKDLPGRRTS